MNQPIENRPTFNICNSSLAHTVSHALKIDQHSSSSCKGTWTVALHGVKHNDFCCFKEVTYDALTLCYKLTSFYIDFLIIIISRICSPTPVRAEIPKFVRG